MPRRKTTVRKKILQELPENRLKYFLTGEKNHSDFVLFSWTPEAMRADWKKFHSEIMREWIKEHPGTRPFFWWVSEAPGWRKVLSGPECLGHIVEIGPTFDPSDYLMLCTLKESKEQPLMSIESEAAFLDRAGLLTNAERKKVSDADFEPETIRFDLSEIEI